MARVDAEQVGLPNGNMAVIRCVEPDEAGALLAYLRLIDSTSEHRLMEPGERSTEVEAQRAWLEEKLADPRSLAIGAFDGNEPAGFLNFRGNARRRTAHHGTFGVSVHPIRRGGGIGTGLIRRLLAWAAVHPELERVGLSVFASNVRARALYERLGFREECRREKEFKLGPGTYVDGIEMSTWVKPVR